MRIELDHEIIVAFIHGDAIAFHRMYAAFRQKVYAYCLYFMGEESIAKDAFQEVFMKIHVSRAQLREPRALEKWITTITRSVCLNVHRAKSRQPEFLSIDAPEHAREWEHEMVSHPPEVDSEDVRRALRSIPIMYREAVLLREFEGYEYAEIAQLVGTTIPNVQVRVTRGKSLLRALLLPQRPIARRSPDQHSTPEPVYPCSKPSINES